MKPAQVYDLLQELFGIGDDDGTRAWWQVRSVEIGKIGRMLKSRHCTAEEVIEAARYAHGMGIPITASWQIFELVPEALQARRIADSRTAAETHQADRSAAIREALDQHDPEWAQRLMRTPDVHLETVLKEWRSHER